MSNVGSERDRVTREAGFSTMEVVIAGALMIAVSLGVTQLLQFNAKTAGSISATADFNSLVASLQGILGNSDSCKTAFENRSFIPPGVLPGPISPAQNLTAIKTGGASGTIIIPAAGGQIGQNLRIEKLQWVHAASLGAPRQYLVRLYLEAKKIIPGGAVGSPVSSHNFDVVLQLDGSNNIIDCFSTNTSFWRKTPSGSAIFYDGGNVGIGTNAPQAMLDVAGGIKAGTATIGQPCSSEGVLGYDSTRHQPTYCNEARVWSGMGAGTTRTFRFMVSVGEWGYFSESGGSYFYRSGIDATNNAVYAREIEGKGYTCVSTGFYNGLELWRYGMSPSDVSSILCESYPNNLYASLVMRRRLVAGGTASFSCSFLCFKVE